MALKTFRQVQTNDRVLGLIQQNVADAFDPITKTPILGGNLLSTDDASGAGEYYSGIRLTAGVNNYINHRLNRKLQGWIITRKRAQSDVWDSQDELIDGDFPPYTQETTLVLNCSSNVTIDLWVF